MAMVPRALEHRHVSCIVVSKHDAEVVVRVTDDFPLADVEAFYPVVDILGRVCQVSLGGKSGLASHGSDILAISPSDHWHH